MHQRYEVRKLVYLSAFFVLLQGCSESEDPADGTVFAITAGEQTYDLEMSGSVGDGPVVDAILTVSAKNAEILGTTISDQKATYRVQLLTQDEHYPLTIEASGGYDLVTGLPLDFTLFGAATDPRGSVVANVNPFTTLAVATARQMTGGLSASSLATALDTVVSEFNLGLTSQLSLDPMTTPIDELNLAEIVKSSEALAEIFRRTATTIQAASFNGSVPLVIDAIAADLVDGVLDGQGGSQTNRNVSATALMVAAQVALESMRNELRVNDQVVTPILDEVITGLSSGQLVELTDSRPVTSQMIARALQGVDAAIALGGSGALEALRVTLSSLPPGVSAANARQLLSADAATTLDAMRLQIGSGSLAAIDTMLTGSPSPVNTAPVISGTPPGTAVQSTFYQFVPSASDPDGDRLTFGVRNGPSWLTFNASTGELSGTPGAADVGTYSNIEITVTDGQETVRLPPFSIAVQTDTPPPVNSPPVISGTPASSVLQDSAYRFLPGASDADGDTLTFAVVGQPAWAAFNVGTGELTGTPTAADVGTYSGITIGVSDGQASVSLPPFAITVQAVNTPPVISGTPASSVLQDSAYRFLPGASDADGDTLTFAVVGRPAWAAFNTGTGELTGTPTAADVGTYSGITISVSDGQASVSLPAFSITVDPIALGTATLSWTPPTTNVDGNPLLDLAGYRIRWGPQSGSYTNEVTIMTPGIASYVVENLPSGMHFFTVTALTANGLESAPSNEASKAIP